MAEEEAPIKKSPNAGIQQLHLNYDKQQDRLLFKVGLSDNSEIVLWLTYRFSRQLWLELNVETELPVAKPFEPEKLPVERVKQFKQEVKASEALQKIDFATKYAPRKTVRNDKVMLATEMKPMKEGAQSIDIKCHEGMTVHINLNKELILALCNMLQITTKKAGWDMSAPAATAVKVEENQTGVLH